jgi:uncharacterized protein YjcR
MNKKEIAKELFLSGKTLKEIAKLIDVNDSTVRTWKDRNKWYKTCVSNDECLNKKGRKSKYYTMVKPKLNLVEKLKSEGMPEYLIIKKLHVNHQSWNEYKKQFPELIEKLKKGDENYNKLLDDKVNKVEKTLYDKATGDYIEEVEIINYDAKGRIVEDKKTGVARTITRSKKADTTANIFILKNRKSSKYNQDLNHKKYVDEEKLKIDREKIKIDQQVEDNTQVIKEFLEATKSNKEELNELFSDDIDVKEE